jgi:hypothetical protein
MAMLSWFSVEVIKLKMVFYTNFMYANCHKILENTLLPIVFGI